MKKKQCSLCYENETGNFSSDNNIKLICSRCVQTFLGTRQEVIKDAYIKLIEKGNIERAELIKVFMEKEEANVRTKPIKVIGKGGKNLCSYKRRVAYGRKSFHAAGFANLYNS